MTVLRQRADGSIQSQPVIISAGQLNKPNITELSPLRHELIEAVSGAHVRHVCWHCASSCVWHVRRHVFDRVRRHMFGTVRRHVFCHCASSCALHCTSPCVGHYVSFVMLCTLRFVVSTQCDSCCSNDKNSASLQLASVPSVNYFFQIPARFFSER